MSATVVVVVVVLVVLLLVFSLGSMTRTFGLTCSSFTFSPPPYATIVVVKILKHLA